MPGPGSAPLVGRERELSQLRAFADDAANGGSLVMVGDAGVGKTVLADALRDYAAGLGMRTLVAAGVEFEAEVGFAGLHQLLSPLLPELAGLPSAYQRAVGVTLGVEDGTAPDRLTLINALIKLLAREDGIPVLIVLDDAHWLDSASASVLATLARRLKGTSVALIAVMRMDQPSVFHEAGIAEVAVGPLDRGSATALLATMFPYLSQRAVQTVLAEAQGNPLALIELPVRLGADPSEPGIGRTPVGRRLRQHFERLISTLPSTTRDQLLRAALDGSGELFPAEPVPDLEPAERARIVRVHPVTRRPQFRHPLARSSVVQLDRRGASQRPSGARGTAPCRFGAPRMAPCCSCGGSRRAHRGPAGGGCVAVETAR